MLVTSRYFLKGIFSIFWGHSDAHCVTINAFTSNFFFKYINLETLIPVLFYTTENHGWSDTSAGVTFLCCTQKNPGLILHKKTRTRERQKLKFAFQQNWDQSTVLIEVISWHSASRETADLSLPALLAPLCSLESSFYVEYTPLLM